MNLVNDTEQRKKRKGKEAIFTSFAVCKREVHKEMGLWMSDVVPFAAMVIVECVNVGISTISKAAMNGGLNNFVLVVYSDALGTLLLFPFFIFNRLYFSLFFIDFFFFLSFCTNHPYTHTLSLSFAGTSDFLLLLGNFVNSSFLG